MLSSNIECDRQRQKPAAGVEQCPTSQVQRLRLDTQHTWGAGSNPSSPPENRSSAHHPTMPGIPPTALLPSRSAWQSSYGVERQALPHAPKQDTGSQHSTNLSSKSRVDSRGSEKASFEHRSARSHHSSSSRAHHTSVVYEDVDTDGKDQQKVHAMWILVYLSSLAPLLAFTTCIYTVLMSILIFVLSPLSLCISRYPLRVQLERLLRPPLSLHLGLLFSVHEVEAVEGSRAAMLVLVNLFAPFYACGIMLAAWIAAGFWFFAAILGEPNKKTGGNEKDGKDDGRMTVLYVSHWWEAWLIKGLR